MVLGLCQARGAQSIILKNDYNMKDFQQGFRLAEAPKTVTVVGGKNCQGGYIEVEFTEKTVRAYFEYLFIDNAWHQFFAGKVITSSDYYHAPYFKSLGGFLWSYQEEQEPESTELVSDEYILLP